ncbi:lipoprotein [Ralstonia sp. A12]|uniref:EexN family lipoprotein n=1 Tax=Ralstonia sp. A12 TaxID=1217052 RepID=UPI000574FD0D|nr:EexN family lipoprotein [Ralstonia sp. A12]KHK52071.1 lipoprotein [Ralstonia sp. A12]
MNRTASMLLTLMLAACGPSGPPDTVESLVADPERLWMLRKQCKLDRAKLGDSLCNRVAEAINRRFLGDGNIPYNPPKTPPKF